MNRSTRRPATGGAGARPGQVRIIAGRWRGMRLPVPDRPGLRPTSDRMRETLFNWLAPMIEGARVLDAFAGSGALGFEAASRGAAEVTMLERDPMLAAALGEQRGRLVAQSVEVHAVDALQWLRLPATTSFDLVFLDPPFGQGLLASTLPLLVPWLAPAAWVYLEHGHDDPPDVGTLSLHRQARTREARCALYRKVP